MADSTPDAPASPAAVVSENDLVVRARDAVSDCNWVVGECAVHWTKRYARGRTDGDFGTLIGCSADQVFQRRRVWETFGDVRTEYAGLRWSHYYLALTWDDAPECLAWAAENDATVAEMKAWRRLQNGEDLSQPADDDVPPWEEGAPVSFVPDEPTAVRDPSGRESSGGHGSASSRGGSEREPVATASGFARDVEGGTGGTESSGETARTAVVEKPSLPAEQVVKRMTSSIERVNKALTAELIEALPTLPKKVRNQFVKAVGELTAKVAKLV